MLWVGCRCHLLSDDLCCFIPRLADIGLEKFNGTELFIKLLTPTSFLIVIILQVHYFHKPFMRLSALDRYR